MEMAVTHCRFLVVLTVLIGLVAAKGYAVQSETAVPTTEAAPTTAEPPFALPPVTFSLPPDYNDETAYAHSLADETAKLVTRAEAASDATTRVDLWLAAANMILSRELETPCTRSLLGVSDSVADSRRDAIAALDRADGLLGRAGVLIESERMRTGLPGGWGDTAARRFDALGSFAAALRAVLSEPGAADGADGRRAWSKLSALLEDSDSGVASAAALWQAHLRSREEDAGRALLVLQPAIADPHEGTMPYAFFARLTRCRLLADRGGYAAALALLMQIEERYVDWFSEAQQQPEALRAIRVVEMAVLRGWRDHLTGADQEKERLWCDERAKELQASSFDTKNDDEKNAVLRLSPVIPVVAPPPTPEAESPDPAPDDG